MNSKYKICVIGLGYVGLPLLLELKKYNKVIGFDNDIKRINFLKKKYKKVKFINNLSSNESNVYIVCVSTPINKKNKPNLINLIKATKSLSKVLKKNDLIVYESTVNPGTTEDLSSKFIEKISKIINSYS